MMMSIFNRRLFTLGNIWFKNLRKKMNRFLQNQDHHMIKRKNIKFILILRNFHWRVGEKKEDVVSVGSLNNS